MTIPIRNQIYDRIQSAGSLTDVELSKELIKNEIEIKEDRFNKILLDLEILGLINVSWITKDTRRIEISKQDDEEDEVEAQNKEMMEKEYEASFPGAEEIR